MPYVDPITMDIITGGERAATHPALTILIVCGLAAGFYFFMRWVEAQGKRK